MGREKEDDTANAKEETRGEKEKGDEFVRSDEEQMSIDGSDWGRRRSQRRSPGSPMSTESPTRGAGGGRPRQNPFYRPSPAAELEMQRRRQVTMMPLPQVPKKDQVTLYEESFDMVWGDTPSPTNPTPTPGYNCHYAASPADFNNVVEQSGAKKTCKLSKQDGDRLLQLIEKITRGKEGPNYIFDKDKTPRGNDQDDNSDTSTIPDSPKRWEYESVGSTAEKMAERIKANIFGPQTTTNPDKVSENSQEDSKDRGAKRKMSSATTRDNAHEPKQMLLGDRPIGINTQGRNHPSITKTFKKMIVWGHTFQREACDDGHLVHFINSHHQIQQERRERGIFNISPHIYQVQRARTQKEWINVLEISVRIRLYQLCRAMSATTPLGDKHEKVTNLVGDIESERSEERV
jgi:hypothetical protein